jgi:hypothetical protein
MLALGPINPNIAAEINSSNATTLSSVSAFARVSFRSMNPIEFSNPKGELQWPYS